MARHPSAVDSPPFSLRSALWRHHCPLDSWSASLAAYRSIHVKISSSRSGRPVWQGTAKYSTGLLLAITPKQVGNCDRIRIAMARLGVVWGAELSRRYDCFVPSRTNSNTKEVCYSVGCYTLFDCHGGGERPSNNPKHPFGVYMDPVSHLVWLWPILQERRDIFQLLVFYMKE